MANQAALTNLTAREAVADALYRCLLGIDSNDRDLFESACLKAEDMTVTAGPIDIKGWSAINDFFARLFTVVTTHVTSNIRIDLLDGAETASMFAHAMSYHIKPEDALKVEDTSYTASSLYSIDLVRNDSDGLWKIKRWDIKVLWITGDRAVLHG